MALSVAVINSRFNKKKTKIQNKEAQTSFGLTKYFSMNFVVTIAIAITTTTTVKHDWA